MELKPCPFCGGPASLGYNSGNEVYPQSWNPGCEKCGIRFKAYGSSSWATNKKEDEAARLLAIGVWNKRVPVREVEALPAKWRADVEQNGSPDWPSCVAQLCCADELEAALQGTGSGSADNG